MKKQFASNILFFGTNGASLTLRNFAMFKNKKYIFYKRLKESKYCFGGIMMMKALLTKSNCPLWSATKALLYS